MSTYLDQAVAKNVPVPVDGKPYRIEYDGDDPKAVKGFGLRVTKAGARSDFGEIEKKSSLGIGARPEVPAWEPLHGKVKAHVANLAIMLWRPGLAAQTTG
jgi:hypothetical protein